MAAIDTQELRRHAPAWIRDTRDEAARELAAMRHALGATLNALATDLAGRSRNDDVAPIEQIQEVAAAFLGTVRRLMTRVCDRLAEGMHERLTPLKAWTHHGPDAVRRTVASELARWETSVRFHEITHTQYVAGWVEGGGLALALMMDLPPGSVARAEPYKQVLQVRLGFVADRADAAIAQWLDEVERGILALVPQIEAQLAHAPATPAAPASASPHRGRVDALLALAESLQVRIKNVPAEPSDRYLDKLEAQLAQVERRKLEQAAAEQARHSRLDDLMRFAQSLNVRPRDVPSEPSDAWLDRMESKLAQMARRRGIELPPNIYPSTAIESQQTQNPAPDREAGPGWAASAPQLSVRVQALLERAESVGLDLGRVPDQPSESWVADTEARLAEAVEDRRSRRRAMRLRRRTEQDVRLDRVLSQSEDLRVPLGPVPDPVTEEWLTGAEMAMAGALLDSEQSQFDGSSAAGSEPTPESDRRLRSLLNAASAAGVDLGIIPPQPDDVWFLWARNRVDESVLDDDDIDVEEDWSDGPQAYLIYEEGTVQEQQWPVGLDAIFIGRSRGNDVQIPNDPAVSRRHASLQMRGGEYRIADLGSTKGTLVDDEPIGEDHSLHDGARIQVGETGFVFRMR